MMSCVNQSRWRMRRFKKRRQMKTPSSNCPRCNSNQSFPRLRRPTSLPLEGVQEAYVRCTMCHWESILEYTTANLEMLKLRKLQAGKRAMAEHRRLGAVSNSTSQMTLRLVRQTTKFTEDLNHRVQAVQNGERANENAA